MSLIPTNVIQYQNIPDTSTVPRNNIFLRTMLCIFTGLLVLALLYRKMLFSNWQALPDDGDTLLMVAIYEHWFRVFQGLANWLSPNFYFPAQGVLGYSDALFLQSLPYSLFRCFGYDEFTSYQLTLLCVSSLSFVGMSLLLKKSFALPLMFSLLGGILFTIYNGLTIQFPHTQLFAVAAVPWLSFFILHYISISNRQSWQGWLTGIGVAVLLPALLFTSFYIGWYFVFFCASLICVAVLYRTLRLESIVKQGINLLKVRSYQIQWSCFLVIASTVFMPFLLTYLPVLKQVGSRSYGDVTSMIPEPVHLLYVGTTNLIYSKLLSGLFDQLSTNPHSYELRGFAVPLCLLLLFLASTIVLLIKHFSRMTKKNSARKLNGVNLVLALGLTVVASWFMLFKWANGMSLWWFVFHYIPGASAIRAVARYGIVLILPIIIVAMYGLSKVWSLVNNLSSNYWKTLLKVGLVSCTVLLVAEEVNSESWSASKSKQLAILARIDKKSIPKQCRAFYMSNEGLMNQDRKAIQMQAMLLAERLNIPTINGYSGWAPKGWDLGNTHASDYLLQVSQWLLQNKLYKNVYAFDLKNGKVASDTCVNEVCVIDFTDKGNSRNYRLSGWDRPESWGTWSIRSNAKLVMSTNNMPNADLSLIASAIGLISPLHPRCDVDVVINNVKLGHWQFVLGEIAHVRNVVIPAAMIRKGKPLEVVFQIANPCSPKSIGLWENDDRKLGIGLFSLCLVKVSSDHPN